MRTIEQRAKEAWADYEYREGELYQSCFTDGFVAGAKSERADLTFWRDPKVELPKDGEEVLAKVEYPFCMYDVVIYDSFGWRLNTSAGGGLQNINPELITGWRPIREE